MGTNLLFTLNTNKITLIALFLITVSFQNLQAQALGQDSNGFSSIVIPSSNLNIDGTNNVITISYIQLDRILKNEDSSTNFSINKCFYDNTTSQSIKECLLKVWDSIENNYSKNNFSLLYGAELKGTSKTGIATILNEGLFANSASINGTFGVHIKNKKHYRKSLDDYISLKLQHSELINLIEEHKISISSYVSNMINDGVITKEKAKGYFLKYTFVKGDKDYKNLNIIEEIRGVKQDLKQTNKPVINTKKRLEEVQGKIEILQRIDEIASEVLSRLKPFPKMDSINKSDIIISYLRSQKTAITKKLDSINQGYNKSNTFKTNIKLEKYLEEDGWTEAKKNITKNIGYLKGEETQLNMFSEDSTIKKYVDELITLYDKFLDTLLEYKDIREKLTKIESKQLDYDKHSIYGKAGFIGKSFLYDLDNGGTTIDSRIEKRNFQGTRFEIGWTYQIKSYNFFGINLSKDYTDNSGTLTSNTFTFKTIDNTVTPNLEVANEITALTDPYDKFHDYQISVDYVRLISLRNKNKGFKENSSPKVYLNINPYFRHHFYSGSETLKPNTSFGLGMYAFNIEKNSIAGGLFVQADDVFNVNRQMAINFTRQISVGLVFKYALSSFSPK